MGKDLAQVRWTAGKEVPLLLREPQASALPCSAQRSPGTLAPPRAQTLALLLAPQACRDQYPRKVSFFLWILAEAAIAACDMAEVIGSAIALHLLTGLPHIAGVFITTADVLIVLAIMVRPARAAPRSKLRSLPSVPAPSRTLT